ncbi:MAG: DUF6273 domain-containing protein [Propionibacteriaceae bacterium]|nr:DUF6273 domain-containing protein [Propionibacteriaceae bacterium]
MARDRLKVAGLATVVVASALVTGTWAFFGSGQNATNDIAGGSTPGVRLHDDFDATAATTLAPGESVNKDVYVENWGTYATYVRVRLGEYLERGYGERGSSEQAPQSIDGAAKADTATWRSHVVADADGTPAADAKGKDPFHDYYTLKLGGQKYYLPSDNHDEGAAPDAAKVDNQLNYADPGDRVSAAQTSADDTDRYTVADTGYDSTATDGHESLPHSAAGLGVVQTPLGGIVTMAAWIAADPKPVNVWVSDTDGWYYWVGTADGTTPIGLAPGAATGLLLDQITLNVKPESDSWYYAVHAELQAISAEDKYGFSTGDRTITENAWTLLETIGGFSLLKPGAAAVLAATHPAVPASSTGTRTVSTPYIQNLDDLVDRDAKTTPTYEVVADETTASAAAIDLSGSTLTYTPTVEEGAKVIVVKATIGNMEKKLTFNVNASKVAYLSSAYTVSPADSTGYLILTAAGINWYIIDVGGDAYGDGTANDPGVVYLWAKNPLATARAYNAGTSNDWDGSDLQVWLNDDSAGFLKTLTDADPTFASKILTTHLWTAQTSYLQDYVQGDSKVFVQSPEELFGVIQPLMDYDPDQDHPPREPLLEKNLYPGSQLFDAAILKVSSAPDGARYWMRGPGRREDAVAAVTTATSTPQQGVQGPTAPNGVRPALRVDLSPTP